MSIAKNKMVLVVLFLTIIASGCTGGGSQEETSNTKAVEVNEFDAFPNPTPANQNTRFRMRVTNVGDKDAQHVYARMFNPPFATASNQPMTWKDTNSGDSNGDKVDDAERSFSFGQKLRAGDDQTPAVPKTDALNLQAPDLGQDRSINYGFRAYLMYNYSTDASTEIQIMDGDRYRQQGSPAGTASLENSKGPVKLEIRTPTPIVLYDISGNDVPSKELCLIARNKGSGVPFNQSSAWQGTEGWNVSRVQSQEHTNELKISAPDIGSINLTAQDDDGSAAEDQEMWVEILGGQGVGCYKMELGNVGSTSIQRTVPLEFKATYGYRQSSQTSVLVEGRP